MWSDSVQRKPTGECFAQYWNIVFIFIVFGIFLQIVLPIFYLCFLICSTWYLSFLHFLTRYVCCYAPKHRCKFLACENLQSNEPILIRMHTYSISGLNPAFQSHAPFHWTNQTSSVITWWVSLEKWHTAPWVILEMMLNRATARLYIWRGMMCVHERETRREGERRAGCSLLLQPHHHHQHMNRWKQMLPFAFLSATSHCLCGMCVRLSHVWVCNAH